MLFKPVDTKLWDTFILPHDGTYLGVVTATAKGEPAGANGVAGLVNARGLYEFGCVRRSVCGPTFTPENHVLRPSTADGTHRWRMLVRGEFVEVYVDDDFVQCFGFSRPPVRNVGLFVERGEVHLDSLRIHPFA